jgi:hypothetical protein
VGNTHCLLEVLTWLRVLHPVPGKKPPFSLSSNIATANGPRNAWGKLFYFGKVSNGREAALREYRATWDYIVEHGVKPSVQVSQPTPEPDAEPEQLTVKQLVNLFLNSKQEMVKSGGNLPPDVDRLQADRRAAHQVVRSVPASG